jgi:hypothetical protein
MPLGVSDELDPLATMEVTLAALNAAETGAMVAGPNSAEGL